MNINELCEDLEQQFGKPRNITEENVRFMLSLIKEEFDGTIGSVNRAVTQFSLHYHSFFMPPFYLLIVCFDMLLNLLYSPVVMACRC